MNLLKYSVKTKAKVNTKLNEANKSNRKSSFIFKIREFFCALDCLITFGFVSGSSEMFIINKIMPSVDKKKYR